MAGHSGLTNGFVTQDMHGQAPGTQIFYSIQGNILRSGAVVPHAVKAFLDAKGGVTDRVMAAMEAADAAGGDSRCTCQVPAVPAESSSIPCTTRTSLVAYILAADPQKYEWPRRSTELTQRWQVCDVCDGVATESRSGFQYQARREPWIRLRLCGYVTKHGSRLIRSSNANYSTIQ